MNLKLPGIPHQTTGVKNTLETSGFCSEPGVATDRQMEVFSEKKSNTTIVSNVKNLKEEIYSRQSLKYIKRFYFMFNLIYLIEFIDHLLMNSLKQVRK